MRASIASEPVSRSPHGGRPPELSGRPRWRCRVPGGSARAADEQLGGPPASRKGCDATTSREIAASGAESIRTSPGSPGWTIAALQLDNVPSSRPPRSGGTRERAPIPVQAPDDILGGAGVRANRGLEGPVQRLGTMLLEQAVQDLNVAEPTARRTMH